MELSILKLMFLELNTKHCLEQVLVLVIKHHK